MDLNDYRVLLRELGTLCVWDACCVCVLCIALFKGLLVILALSFYKMTLKCCYSFLIIYQNLWLAEDIIYGFCVMVF